MQKFLWTDVWPQIESLARQSNAKSAAIAYFTKDYLHLGEGHRLVVDASNSAIKSRQTDRDLLKRLVDRGVEVYSFQGLHAKTIVLDGTAVVGSMNASEHSSNLQEAAIITDNLRTVGEARAFINELISQSDKVDAAFIKRITSLKLADKIGWPTGAAKRRPRRTTAKPRTWLIGLFNRDRNLDESDDLAIEAGEEIAEAAKTGSESEIDHFSMSGNTKMQREARVGDLVIEILTDGKKKTPTAVYPPVPIRDIRQADKQTWFFTEDWANIEDRSLTWHQFKKLAEKTGVSTKGRPVRPRSVRLLTETHANAIAERWE